MLCLGEGVGEDVSERGRRTVLKRRKCGVGREKEKEREREGEQTTAARCRARRGCAVIMASDGEAEDSRKLLSKSDSGNSADVEAGSGASTSSSGSGRQGRAIAAAAESGVENVRGDGLFHCLFNIVSVTGIVFVNKLVFASGFKFPVTLTFFHIVVTALGMRIFRRAGFFELVNLKVARVAPLALAYNGYVILSNASLAYNSVGFYQIAKILNTPCLMLIERLVYGKESSIQVKLAVAVMSLGIGLATVTDASVTQLGFIIAVASIVFTSVYQILIGRKQKELGVGSMQLLHEKAPIAAGMLAVAIPLMEPTGLFGASSGPNEVRSEFGPPVSLLDWFQNDATPFKLFIIFLSGVMGLLVNWSMFLTIKSTSALTFNVVGHLKTFFIIGGGVVLFGDFISIQKALSLFLAFVGIGWYSYLKLNVSAKPVAHTKGNGSAKT